MGNLQSIMDKHITISPKNIIIFYCSSFKTLNLESRITLSNKTDYHCTAFVQIFTVDAKFIGEKKLSKIPKEEFYLKDLNDFYEEFSCDKNTNFVFLFSIIPNHFNIQDTISISLNEIQELNARQDFYIEHYIPNSISAGVLYQASPIMNNHNIIKNPYFFMQAPKIFLSENQDTIFQFFSPNINNCGEKKHLFFFIKEANGKILCKDTLVIYSGGMNILSIKEVLNTHNIILHYQKEKFLHFEAFSNESIFISLTMQYNKKKQTLDLEHTLSPHYYLRKEKMLKKQSFKYYQKLFQSLD